MKYLCAKRFKGKGLAGHFNIPRGSVLTTNAIGRLCFEDRAVCADTSEVSHNHFVIDDDGQGLDRFGRTQAILKLLSGAKTKTRNKRWDVVMADDLCQTYSRKDHEDHWLWSDAFYKAPLCDLDYILNLIKEV